MYLSNHTHIENNIKNQYFKILEIVGFSCLSFIFGVIYQKFCNGTRIG